MLQRVMIAMALSAEPELLIADEPTTALDVTIQAQILELMRDLKNRIGTAIMLITHDLGVIAEVADRVCVMYAGNIVEVAPVRDLYKHPLHPYSQGLLSSIPRMDQPDKKLESIPGSVPNLIYPPTGCRFHPRCPHAMPICKETRPPMTLEAEGHTVACYLYHGPVWKG
jgi:oligopeptide/dipeptide ABC transporter ATP-binding protein